MTACLSEAEIQQLVTRVLSPEQSSGFEDHLRVCARCAARVEMLRAVPSQLVVGSVSGAPGAGSDPDIASGINVTLSDGLDSPLAWMGAAMPDSLDLPSVPADISLDDFFASLSQSGLLTAAEIARVRERSTSDPAINNLTSVINWLVKEHKLTTYQAKVLARGQPGVLMLGNYIILEKLGQGGMGTVFKARHRRMNRLVALKVLPSALANVPEAIARFQREVQAAASLQHPHIAAAYDADEAAGVHFLVMEYIDGPTLAAVVRARGAIPLAAAVRLVAQAAQGLAAAHAAGIVHRDIKPSNLILNRQGALKVLDLGLAQVQGERASADSADDMTQTGRVMGTVDYMAPEQARDAKSVDHRADIYSLGCTLYFLATGTPPAPPGSAAEKLLWHQTEDAPPLSRVCPQATPRLEALLARLMAKLPEDRPASMAEIVVELERCAAEFPAGEAELLVGNIALASDHTGSTLDGSKLVHATHRDVGQTVAGSQAAPSLPVVPPARPPRSRLIVYACGLLGAGVLAVLMVLPFVNRDGLKLPAPPVLAPVDATLVVEVSDGPAEVFVNGRWMGRAGDNAGRDLEIKVPAGEQLVQVKRDGYRMHEQRIEARSGEPVKVAANLSRIGSLPATRPAVAPAAHAEYEKLLAWVFRNGGSVTAVTGKGQQLALARATPLPDEPLEIIAIRLGGTGIRDAELAHLKDASGLRELSLANTPITDAGLAHLQHLRELTHLDLGETGVTGEGLANVSRLAQLVELDLRKTKVTDPGLTRLAGLSKLQRLYLSDTPVGDAGIEQLRLLPALQHISLHGTGLSEAGHQALTTARPQLEIAWDGADLERQTALRLLEKGVMLAVIDRTGKSHKNLHAREDLPSGRVSVIEVDATSAARFGDDDLKQLALLPRIESLSLAGAAVTPEGLANLHGLTTLKTLDLGALRLPVTALEGLRKALAGCQVVLKEAPNAEVARMVIAAGGKVSIVTDGGALVPDVADTSRLPGAGFVVRSVNAEGISAIDDAAAARLSDLPDLESLFLGRTSITDEGVAHLAGCRALRELSLSETDVTAVGVGALARLPALERLYLANTGAGGEGVRRAAALAQLTHLSLQGVELADDDLALLKRLARLEWLDVSATPLSDAALVHLNQLGKLRQLNISETGLSDAGLEELKAALPTCNITGDPPDPQRLAARWIIQKKGTITLESGQLASLADLPKGACRIVAVDLAEVDKLDAAQLVGHLASCSDVVSINLSDTNLREPDLRFLAALGALRELRLANLPVGDAALKQLAGHGKLEVLDLSGTRVTGAGLVDLATAAELKQLLLANTQIDQKHLSALAAFPKLEVLSLAAGRNISDAGLAHIEKLTALKSLDLRGSKISDAGAARLATLTALEQLDLEGTQVTSAGIGRLTGLTKLRRINLAQTQVTDNVTAPLAQLKQLKSINLARTTVSAEAIRQLQTALPGCAILAPARPPRDPSNPTRGFGPGNEQP